MMQEASMNAHHMAHAHDTITVEPQSYEPLGIFEVCNCEIFISLKLMEF